MLRDEAQVELPKVAVSVDGRVVGGATALGEGDEVAVLVPYAGG